MCAHDSGRRHDTRADASSPERAVVLIMPMLPGAWERVPHSKSNHDSDANPRDAGPGAGLRNAWHVRSQRRPVDEDRQRQASNEVRPGARLAGTCPTIRKLGGADCGMHNMLVLPRAARVMMPSRPVATQHDDGPAEDHRRVPDQLPRRLPHAAPPRRMPHAGPGRQAAVVAVSELPSDRKRQGVHCSAVRAASARRL